MSQVPPTVGVRAQASFRHGVLRYLVAVVLTGVILVFVLKLWKADLHVPFKYDGDGIAVGSYIKNIIETGWYLVNPHVGAPLGGDNADLPSDDTFFIFVIKTLSLFSADSGIVMNLFYLLAYPAITVTSLYAFQKLGLRYPMALSASLLYAFQPYHLFRSEGHLFLSSFYFVPVAILLALAIIQGHSIFSSDHAREERPKPFSRFLRFIGYIGLCLILGSTGIYHAFFTSYFLLVSGVAGSYIYETWKPLANSTILICMIFLTVVINFSPSFFYNANHGENPEAMIRGPGEAEYYGLKITNLVLPVTGHRISGLADFRDTYNVEAPLQNENQSSSLGFLGGVGFLSLLIVFIPKNTTVLQGTLLNRVAILNLSGLLLGIVGGIGSLFAFFVTPNIRAYNRISIFIAFFSLLALFYVVQQVLHKRFPSLQTKVLWAAAPILLAVGLYDQTTPRDVPPYEATRGAFKSDAAFVKRIEDALPPEAMVFQLPYVPCPEAPPPNAMRDYDHFRAYLHSVSLNWSYGSMRGREADLWQREISGKPVKELVKAIAYGGFRGVYVDRFGYADSGKELEGSLSSAIGMKPLVSSNKRLVFYDLGQYTDSLRRSMTATDWDNRVAETLLPLRLPVTWGGGFSTLEKLSSDDAHWQSWRWCTDYGEIYLSNNTHRPIVVDLAMEVYTGYPEYSNLTIESDLFAENQRVNTSGRMIRKTLSIPEGRHVIKFRSDAKRLNAPEDLRVLVFRVANFSVKMVPIASGDRS